MPDANLTARSIFSKCVCMLNDLSNTIIITRTTKKYEEKLHRCVSIHRNGKRRSKQARNSNNNNKNKNRTSRTNKKLKKRHKHVKF